MANAPIDRTELCTDPACMESHAPEHLVDLAAAICRERGVRLTPLRRRVFELLSGCQHPTGAYELLEMLKTESNKNIAPPTVYRALDFLMTQGLISRIESRKAYVACSHPERSNNCLFFICEVCGWTTELEDQRIGQLLAEDATTKLDFQLKRSVVEVQGTCSACVAADPS